MRSLTAAPALFQPVLDRLQRDALAHFGGSDLRLVPCELQERPFSHLLRLRVCRNDDAASSHLFVKISKEKAIPGGGPDAMRLRVARDFEVTRQVHAAMSRYPDVGAVPPVACYPDLLAIVTEQVDGLALLQYLQRHAGWTVRETRRAGLRATMARVGRWIRVFQATGPTGDVIELPELRQYVDIRLERLVRHAASRFTDTDRQRVLRYIDRLGAAIPAEELRQVTAHSDLSLGNLIVAGERIVGLDFAMTRLDSRLHDVTKVFVQLDLLACKPQFRAGLIRQLQTSLVDGFDPALRTEGPLFRLLLLLHRVNHLTGLYVHRATPVQEIHNTFVRRQHWRWIEDELARDGRDR